MASTFSSDQKSHAGCDLNPRVLDIIHFNDVYNLEQIYTEEPVGGAAKYATFIQNLKEKCKKENRKPLILFSGDFVGPSLFSSVTHGAHVIDVLNHVGVDFATFGNHELDYGYASLKARLAGVDDDVEDGELEFIDYPASTAQWIMTNMTEPDTGYPMGGANVKKHVLTGWNGIKIGLLAVSENWISSCSQLRTGEILYEDYIESARTAAIALKAQGAEIVLAITHNRLDNDYKLVIAVPEIDLLLGGHDHFYKDDIDNRIVKSGEEWRWVSHVRIAFPGSAWEFMDPTAKKYVISLEIHDVTSDVSDEPEIKKIVEKYHNLSMKKFNRVIFQMTNDMHPEEEYVRFKESNLANWIADACAEDYSLQDGLQSADFCMLTGFLFAGKEPIKSGPFTLGNLISILPRPLNIMVVSLSGQDVINSLRLGAKSLPGECGSLHHVSANLSYTIEIPSEATDTTTAPDVTNVLFKGAPIELEKMYAVACADSMAKGDYGFNWMKTAPRIVEDEFAAKIQDLVIMYCKRHVKDATFNPANPSMGRITIVQK